MSEPVLFPRLDSVVATERRRALIAGIPSATSFNSLDFRDFLNDPHAFPPTGGRPVDEEELTDFRVKCIQAVDDASGLGGREFNRSVDLRMGRLFYDFGRNSVGEFGNPRVWDFLALVLLPDVVLRRVSSVDLSEGDSGSVTDKLVGGSRRHVFQRLWNRWIVFGPEIVCSERLTEDDYGGMLERRLTLERHQVAIMAAESIVTSGYVGDARRRFARAFLRNLIALSGVVDISESDRENLDDVFSYLKRQTVDMMQV